MSEGAANAERAFPDAAPFPPLRGVIPILVTPFDQDGSVDLAQLDAQIEFLVGRGGRLGGLRFRQRVTPSGG